MAHTSSAPRVSEDVPVTEPSNGVASEPTDSSSAAQPPSGAVTELQEDRIKQLEKALEDLAVQQQEETHNYVEQIDALQAKLQYLAREATDSARKAAKEAPGGLEKKLAEKDQQIAGLMEEGKNLASTEQKLRAIIKSLRSKIGENEKEISNIKTSKGKVEQELEAMRRKSRRADDLEKYQEELHRRIGQSQKEIDALKSEASNKDRTIADLKAQLQKSAEDKDALSKKVNEEALAKERKKVRDLEEQVSDFKVEKDLMVDRSKARENELQEKAERAAERARAVEVELKAEIQVMESKMESMRVMAEEVSSGAMGDSQAKLLRQVETLQTQYAIATENWQGIESTLLARISNLEKERDESQHRESEMRKKAREAVSTVCIARTSSMIADCLTGPPRQASRGRTRGYQDAASHDTGVCEKLRVAGRIPEEEGRRGRGRFGYRESRARAAKDRDEGCEGAGEAKPVVRRPATPAIQRRKQARVPCYLHAGEELQHRATWIRITLE